MFALAAQVHPLGMSGALKMWAPGGFREAEPCSSQALRGTPWLATARALNVATSCEPPCNAPAYSLNFLRFDARDSAVDENSYNNWSLHVPDC